MIFIRWGNIGTEEPGNENGSNQNGDGDGSGTNSVGEKPNRNIYIVTKIEKNYVYYYNSSTRRVAGRTPLLSTLFVMLLVWMLGTG